jgi:hypothetical protein
MSSALSLHTCCRISFSSNTVDSQSMESENGVILTLSSFMSNSSGLAVEDVNGGEVNDDPPPKEEAAWTGDELLDPEGMLKGECQPPKKRCRCRLC